jgi:type IV secretory pathway TrbD component
LFIAHAIIVMKNWTVAGSIGRHFARSESLIQVVYLREFVPEF